MKLSLCVFLFCGFLSCAKETPVSSGTPSPSGITEKDPDVLYQQATQSLALGRYDLAKALLERFSALHPKEERYPKVQSLLLQVEEKLGNQKIRVGVLLPLSGGKARFGDSVWLGIGCAFGLFDPCPKPQGNYRLILKDSEASPESAREAVRNLAQSEKTALIIGPLLSANAKPAADEAEKQGIPLISLAPLERIAGMGSYIFQISLTVGQETSALVRYVRQKNLQKVIIVYPRNRYGAEYKTAFEVEMKKEGREVAASVEYNPREADFASVLRQVKMSGDFFKVYGEAEKKIDAVFLPDDYRAAIAMAQALQIVGLNSVTLLGTSRWNHPSLLSESPGTLEGAVFVAGFYPQEVRPSVQNFTDDFNRAYGFTPGWLEALGFDAAQVAINAIEIRGNDYWPDVRRGLESLKEKEGVLGTLQWDAEGGAQWNLLLLLVQGGALIPVAETPHE